MTGKIGVALSIGGPGLVHLLNGMYDAKMDNVPQLILSGQTNSTLLGTKAFQRLIFLNYVKTLLYTTTKSKKVTTYLKSLMKQSVQLMRKRCSGSYLS